jgi:hypothetical protein
MALDPEIYIQDFVEPMERLVAPGFRCEPGLEPNPRGGPRRPALQQDAFLNPRGDDLWRRRHPAAP